MRELPTDQSRTALVVLFSKQLLRNPLTKSYISELTGSSTFRPVLVDPEHGKSIDIPESIKRVILCSGQVYVALQKHREANGIKNAAIVRIEELAPFPFTQLSDTLNGVYPSAEKIVWAQEEHYNGGAWAHVRDCVEVILRDSRNHADKTLIYAGRGVSATTAAASKRVHVREEEDLIRQAFAV